MIEEYIDKLKDDEIDLNREKIVLKNFQTQFSFYESLLASCSKKRFYFLMILPKIFLLMIKENHMLEILLKKGFDRIQRTLFTHEF